MLEGEIVSENRSVLDTYRSKLQTKNITLKASKYAVGEEMSEIIRHYKDSS